MTENHDHKDQHESDAKEELQRKVEQKRTEIAYTVNKIRSTLTDEVRDRKQAVHELTDWRTYVRKNPVACVGGAAAVGFFVGRALAKKAAERYYHEEPDWRDRMAGYYHSAERKFDELRGRAVEDESKWKARTRSAFSSGSDLLFRELAKAAQHMIIPTVVAAVTGKMASDNKTTVIEKNVHKTAPGMPDHEVTTGVTQVEDGKVQKATGTAPSVNKAEDAKREADKY